MAVPSNTVTEHAVVGTREDLSDIIHNISPTDTPFMTMCGREKADQVYHEWQTDELAAPATNAAVEGDDPTAAALTPTVRIGNICQISQKTVIVSGTSEASDHAGRSSEFSYQVVKRGRELKRDMEFALTRNQASTAASAGNARTSAGLESWIETNVNLADGTVDGVVGGFGSGVVAAPTDGTERAFTKAQLDGVIQDCWAEGGNPTTIMVGPANRQVISTFSGISTLQTDATASGDVTMIGAIDFYKSNFGTLKVVPNRFQRDRTAFVLDPEMWAIAYLRPMTMHDLAKTGDSKKKQLLCEYTLVSKNEKASGKVADLLAV